MKIERNKIFTGGVTIKLAGLVSGFFGDYIPGELQETKIIRPYQLLNYGIAAVTPSYLIREILYSDELKNERKRLN
jgi:hypothetical protein